MLYFIAYYLLLLPLPAVLAQLAWLQPSASHTDACGVTKTQGAIPPTKWPSCAICSLPGWPPPLWPGLSCQVFIWLLFLAFGAALLLWPWPTSHRDRSLLFYQPFSHSMLAADLGSWVLGWVPGVAASLPRHLKFLSPPFSRFGAFWMFEDARRVVSKELWLYS